MRSLVLHALPKIVISRTTGLLAATPLPRVLRAPVYRWFSRRYGVDRSDVVGELDTYRSLGEFFARPLADGARPIADGDVVAPCDGKIVTAGAITNGRIPQVKGSNYSVAELVGDAELAAALDGGSQATIYLAPGDYHRVHAAFGGTVRTIRSIGGTLFPVNPPAVRCIDRLFVRNARRVFVFDVDGGRRGAIVMVGALNVGGIRPSVCEGDRVGKGAEIGQFRFGSTTVALLDGDGPGFPEAAPERVVRMGERLD